MFSLQFGKSTTLAAQMTAAEVTSATLAASNFTNFTADYLVIDYDVPAKREVIKCNVTGTAISAITRAQEGTSAVQHEIGAKVGYNFVPAHYAALAAYTTAADTWTTANPTFDVNTLDNGSGGQPTIAYAKYRQVGKLVTVHAKISGTKAGTDMLIKTTAWALPTAATITTGHFCGVAGYDNGSAYVGLAGVVYRSAGVWWICANANITDNTSMVNGLSVTFEYEAE